MFASEGAKCQVTAFLVFIRIVATVVRAVTHPVVVYAVVVPTFKLVGCAKFVWEKKKEENSAFLKKTIGRYLHWKSLKINTLAFLNCSVFRWQLCETLTTVCFISSILTVVFLITGPAHWNATPAGTSKEVHWTFKLSVIWKKKKKKEKQDIGSLGC